MIESLKTTAITLGDGVVISWLQILYSLLFVFVAWFISRLLAFLIVRKLLSKTKISPDSIAIIQRILFFAMIIMVFLSVLTYLGIPLATFAFISGAVAIGFGFGAKTIIENFLSGWILMSERPIRMGDIIELDGYLGVVIEIGNRSTQIRRNDGAHIIFSRESEFRSHIYFQSKEMEMKFPRGLWHASLFYLCGRLVQDVLAERDISHELVMDTKDIFSYFNTKSFRSILEKFYQNEVDMKPSVRALLEDLIARK